MFDAAMNFQFHAFASFDSNTLKSLSIKRDDKRVRRTYPGLLQCRGNISTFVLEALVSLSEENYPPSFTMKEMGGSAGPYAFFLVEAEISPEPGLRNPIIHRAPSKAQIRQPCK